MANKVYKSVVAPQSKKMQVIKKKRRQTMVEENKMKNWSLDYIFWSMRQNISRNPLISLMHQTKLTLRTKARNLKSLP